MNITNNQSYNNYNPPFGARLGWRATYELKKTPEKLAEITSKLKNMGEPTTVVDIMSQDTKKGRMYSLRLFNEIFGDKYNVSILKDNHNQDIVSASAKDFLTAIENLTNHVPEIIIYMNSHPIDFEGLSQTNKEKLDLYLASQFLYAAQSYGNMDPQRFLIYVANYFKEHPEKKQDTKLQITVGSINNERMGIFKQGKVLTPKDIYEQYKTFLVSHPEIQLLTFTEEELEGLTLEEAEELVKNKIETIQANWKFLPAGGLEQMILTAAQEPKGDVTEEEKKRHQERLLDLFIEKKELYESSNPIAMIQGEDTFDGYIGFIYPNGKVILDKFFENVENGRVADGQAIYIMDFSDFVRLSVLPKRELIINPACRRIIHAGDWQSRVQEEINAPQRNQPEPILQELEGERKVYKMTKSTSPKYF